MDAHTIQFLGFLYSIIIEANSFKQISFYICLFYFSGEHWSKQSNCPPSVKNSDLCCLLLNFNVWIFNLLWSSVCGKRYNWIFTTVLCWVILSLCVHQCVVTQAKMTTITGRYNLCTSSLHTVCHTLPYKLTLTLLCRGWLYRTLLVPTVL